MSVLSKLETCPTYVLEEIAVSLVSMTFLGPPSGILLLLPLSKNIWRKIALEFNTRLYARIFTLKFDVHAAVRRLGDECGHPAELAQELVRRCVGLRRIKGGLYLRSNADISPDDDILRVDLWMAYLMFTESDGKNARQLIDYAMIGRLVQSFVISGGRFHDGTERNSGWTVDNEVNALTAWLFWFTDKERLPFETRAERQSILEAFAHFFVGSFKYASSYAPITSFHIPPYAPPPLPAFNHALPLAASPVPPPCTIPEHYGFEITLARPLLTPAALLVCIVRLEAAASIPFLPAINETKAMGMEDTLMDDSLDQEKPMTTTLVEWSRDVVTGSEMHEHDWMRLRTCYDPWSQPARRDRVYTPGMLSGVWVGRWFGIAMSNFESVDALHEAVHTLPQPDYATPMQFRLREHHQHDPNAMAEFDDIACDGTGRGVFNAWLPEGTVMVENENGLQVDLPDSTQPSKYRTYNPSAPPLSDVLSRACEHEGLYGQGVWDIILTADPDETFGRIWGHKHYHGRVRDWDGLVVLVREATNDEGQWIFRGYVHGKKNLVGRWRETETPVDVAGWEGVWSMTKTDT